MKITLVGHTETVRSSDSKETILIGEVPTILFQKAKLEL